MKRILKFDFYKAVKSVSTWIILLCVAVFTIASMTITYGAKNGSELPDAVMEISEGAAAVSLEKMTVADWCMDAAGGDFLMLFVIVFAVLFTCGDYSTGFMKNIYNPIRNKWKYVLSKMIVTAVFTVLTVVLTYAIAMIYNLIIIRSAAFGNGSGLLWFTLYKTILLIAYGCVGVMVSFILRKTTAALIVCMGYSFMFANLIYTGVNQLARGAGAAAFDIRKYTLVGNILLMGPNMQGGQKPVVWIVCFAAAAVSFLVSTMLFSKRDI